MSLVPRDEGPIERQVLDGEIVDEQASKARRVVQHVQTHPVATRAKVVVTHHRTRQVAKLAARNLLYVPAGAGAVAKRVVEANSTGLHRRMIRSAEAAGDRQGVADWEARSELAKERRHKRLMDWAELPGRLVKAGAIGLAALTGLLLGLGFVLAVSQSDAGLILAPIGSVIDFITWVAWAVSLAWGPIVLLGPWVGLLWLWNEGRKHSTSTGWLSRLQPPAADAGLVVTADGIVRALQKLGLSKLDQAFRREEWLPRFDVTPVRDGNGYRAVFDLPMGVTPEQIADKRDVLARNLHRTEVEVWPSDYGKAEGGRAGYVDLWVANPGVLNKPAPEYPLMYQGRADVFAGVPLGVSQRGDEVTVPLVGNDYVTGGMTGQGKSNIVRVMMLGAALDPLAELWVFVFAGNGDFTAYKPRLARYRKGADDQTVVAALEALRELYAETGRREGRLDEIGAKKLTRQIAEKHADLRPIVVAFSEVHELFGHKEHGEEAAELAVATMRRARKTGISLGFDTQSSRKDSIPPKIVELTKVNLCLAVKTWRSNDGFLGDGSFSSGVRATELRPGVDRGTCVATGVSESPFEIVKSYFVAVDDDTGWDAATEVIARATANVAAGTSTAADRPAEQIEAERDLLADLVNVLGDEVTPAARAARLLQQTAPEYRNLTGRWLRQRLDEEYGIKVPSTDGKWPIYPDAIRQALAEQ